MIVDIARTKSFRTNKCRAGDQMRAVDQMKLSIRSCRSLIVNEKFFLVLPALTVCQSKPVREDVLKQEYLLKGSPQPGGVMKKTVFVSFQSTCKIKRDNWNSPKLYIL